MRWVPIIVVLASCAGDPTSSETSGAGASSSYQLQGTKLQGTKLQGTKLQGTKLQGTKLQGQTLQGVTLSGTTLAGFALVPPDHLYPVSGMDFIGATLYGVDVAGNEIEFLVSDIVLDPESPSGDVLLYTLLYRDPQTGVWDNACEPDLDGVQAAIPMHGTWDDEGARHESDTLVTFGCVSGVLAKCVRWGYRPWTVNGRNLIPYHQACTRMARADYCGDGVSHTLDGTLIDVWDGIGIQQRTPGSGMLFEASWVESGAYCVSKARWNVDGVTLLLECPERVRLPSLQDLVAGCLVKLTTAPRSAIRTNDDSYVGLSLP